MKSSTGHCLGVSLALASGILLAGSALRAQEMETAAPAKIEPWVMENTRAGAQAEFFVVLEKQADLSAAAKLKSKLSKGTFVASAGCKQPGAGSATVSIAGCGGTR